MQSNLNDLSGDASARSAVNEVKDSCNAIAAKSAAHKVIAKKTALDTDRMSYDMLSDPASPTPEEIAAVRTFTAEYAVCQQNIVSFVQETEPNSLPVVQDGIAKKNQAAQLFLGGHMTWGQYNRLVYQVTLEVEKRFTTRARDKIVEAQADELENRQTVAAAGPNAPPRPYTECLWAEGTISCTFRVANRQTL